MVITPCRSVAVLAAVAAAVLSCGGTSMPAGQTGVVVEVRPPTAQVRSGGSVSFGATVTGTSQTGVVWSVQEGSVGGTISSTGLYTAPQSLGTYHVVATSTFAPPMSGTAAVTVTPAQTYGISGTITPAATGAGATVTLGGAVSATTNADASGNYGFASLPNGSYTVTPSGTSLTFSPTSQAVTVNGANVSGVNFTVSTGATVLFFDDFTAPALGSQWVALNRRGDSSNSETECYAPSQITLSGGVATISTTAQTTTCSDSVSGSATYNTLSGYMQWQPGVTMLYGTVEVRAMVAGPSTWPAIWMLGSDCQASNISSADNTGTCNWPQPGSDEIDIAEFYNLTDRSQVQQNLYSSLGNATCYYGLSNASANWHTYTLVWQPGSLTWKVDGVTSCTTTGAKVPTKPMFLIINTANRDANPSGLPETFEIDYVRVTQP